jgi:hypothetical protein
MQSCVKDVQTPVTPVVKQRHTSAPVVSEVSDLLHPSEADYLIAKAKNDGLMRSTVVGKGVAEERTSSTAHIAKGSDDVVATQPPPALDRTPRLPPTIDHRSPRLGPRWWWVFQNF